MLEAMLMIEGMLIVGNAIDFSATGQTKRPMGSRR